MSIYADPTTPPYNAISGGSIIAFGIDLSPFFRAYRGYRGANHHHSRGAASVIAETRRKCGSVKFILDSPALILRLLRNSL